ncbi:SCA7, zinc-binding domain-containing protein [Lineolata rhizophorae]|uniref:SCA7, zinc-binding domain-containing protein n=1 Tax=Lineolata rhizophorae TaxID=578093 RepID=A0A6A6NYA0_9PEZI|nr:SCA7, zinc-binding domain-containing protein [Lineolata rhizophorae]
MTNSQQQRSGLASYDDVFSEKDKKKITLKFKQPAPKVTKPGNWKESEVVGDSKKQDSTSNLVNRVDEKTASSFPTSHPLEDEPDKVQCKHCKRTFARHVAVAHTKECLSKKQEKQRKKKEAKEAKDAAARREKGGEKASEAGDGDNASVTAANGETGSGGAQGGGGGARKSAKKATALDGDGKKGKKRKADTDAEKAPKTKKKKDEPKPKVAKPKGPVDVEKQCGVQLPNGAQCARSLTCKSHSMGAKRAVPGRSLPYDMLLAAYQKKNQAKQQRAAIDANAPLADDFEASGPVDSDEEREAIMAAIQRARPQPLVSNPLITTREKYQYIRMKEMVRNAFVGAGAAATASVGGSSTAPIL